MQSESRASWISGGGGCQKTGKAPPRAEGLECNQCPTQRTLVLGHSQSKLTRKSKPADQVFKTQDISYLR